MLTQINKTKSKQKLVAYWMLIGAVMIIIQVLLGGITRITESGLSITEWRPIDGSLPPLSQKAWQELFDKYKQTDQFIHLKNNINLSNFKAIFFWEWLHRNWARLIGIIFILPFLHFLYHKIITKKQALQYCSLLILGIFQALMGWWMVRSGLKEGNLFVEHTFLCLHFILALMTLALCLYFALIILVPKSAIIYNPKIQFLNKVFFIILIIQLIYGAFMSGTHAAMVASTWPTINGDWVPDNLFNLSPTSLNFINNKITIQFIHRLLAYILLILSIIWFRRINKIKNPITIYLKYILMGLICTQILLGISSLLTAQSINTFKVLAVCHQFIGMLIFTYFIIILFFIRKQECKN